MSKKRIKAFAKRRNGIVGILCLVMVGLFMTISCDKSEIIEDVGNSETSELLTDNDIVLIAKGYFSRTEGEYSTRQNVVITDSITWNHLKATLNIPSFFWFADSNTIDFSISQVVALFDEVKSNGEWSIDITEVIEHNDSIAICVTNLDTGNITCIITQPFHIVQIPVSNKPIVFQTNYKNIGGIAQ